MRVGICSPRLEIFSCKLALLLISPRALLGSVCVFLRSSEFCRALFEISRPSICTPLNSLQRFLKTAVARLHGSLFSPRAPLGSPNGLSVTSRILSERSEVGVVISSGEFGFWDLRALTRILLFALLNFNYRRSVPPSFVPLSGNRNFVNCLIHACPACLAQKCRCD